MVVDDSTILIFKIWAEEVTAMKKTALLIAGFLLVGCTKTQPPPPATLEERIKALQDVVAKMPSYENHIALGLELAAAKRNDEAIAAYTKATTINPKAPLAWNNLCAELNGQHRFGEALQYCEKAVQADPNFTLAKNNLEFAKAKITETKAALAKKKAELMASDKKTGIAVLDLGMEFYNVQDYDSANDLWKSIKKKDPAYPRAQNNLASAYIITGKLDLADQALKEALGAEPENQLFKNNKNWLEQKRKELKTAPQ